MTDMIDRVARAIDEAHRNEKVSDEMWAVCKRHSAFKTAFDCARAAIAAMRKPTQEMLDAGTNAGLPGYDYAPPDTTYPAMIDAALECSTKPDGK